MKRLNINIKKLVMGTLLILTILGFIFAIYMTFSDITNPKDSNLFLIFPFVFFLTPYLILSLYDLKKVEGKIQVIPRFLRDIVDNVESGRDLISSIKTTVGNDYGVLTEDIKKFANQLSWGVDFEEALLLFAKNVGSSSLRRDFLLVTEARKVGGHVEKILRELSEKINIENLRDKERKSNLASNTFTGYISFFIFVFIIIITYNSLFVGLSDSLVGGEENQQNIELQEQRVLVYLTLLQLLAYELSILSGFLFGLMQTNNIIGGGPHVVALTIFTFFAFFFFI